jgi:hypothetical protein
MTKKIDLGEQFKSLRQWAEELLNNDDFPRFLDFCKWENKPTDMISYAEFLTLKEKFEA